MSIHKDAFTLETALTVVRHPTVDGRLWAEAVEWLLLYGPPRVRDILLGASRHATSRQFPELTPAGVTPEGESCYRLDELARALGSDEEEIRELLERKAARQDENQLPRGDDIGSVQ